MGFPSDSAVKNLPASRDEGGWLPELERSPGKKERKKERSPGEGNGNPFQYSCLGNPMDRDF